MTNNHWAPEGTKEFFLELDKIKGYHPAVYQLFPAVVDLCNVKPRSMTQQWNAINTFRFIIRAINAISENDDRYKKIKIEDPWEIHFDVPSEKNGDNVLQFRRKEDK